MINASGAKPTSAVRCRTDRFPVERPTGQQPTERVEAAVRATSDRRSSSCRIQRGSPSASIIEMRMAHMSFRCLDRPGEVRCRQHHGLGPQAVWRLRTRGAKRQAFELACRDWQLAANPVRFELGNWNTSLPASAALRALAALEAPLYNPRRRVTLGEYSLRTNRIFATSCAKVE